jgi:hypothetical protein
MLPSKLIDYSRSRVGQACRRPALAGQPDNHLTTGVLVGLQPAKTIQNFIID